MKDWFVLTCYDVVAVVWVLSSGIDTFHKFIFCLSMSSKEGGISSEFCCEY
jgi:hypothetical protein